MTRNGLRPVGANRPTRPEDGRPERNEIMSANVETMMYVREKPWHGLGTRVEEAPNSLEALRLAELNWEVKPQLIAVAETGELIPNAIANVRSSDGKVLGLVTDRYKIVQNTDAFAFTDTLIGGDVRYETAGSLNGGRKVWLLARLPERKVVGDDVEPYLCFTNAHDGSGAVKVFVTPVRVVCNNTLNLALRGAQRTWSVRHNGDINRKIAEAKHCLQLADEYMKALDENGERMAEIKVDEAQLEAVLTKLFKKPEEDATDREKRNFDQQMAQYYVFYSAPDIAQFKGTAWGAVNAMADMVAHQAPLRAAANYAENNWGRIMTGHALVDQLTGALTGVGARA